MIETIQSAEKKKYSEFNDSFTDTLKSYLVHSNTTLLISNEEFQITKNNLNISDQNLDNKGKLSLKNTICANLICDDFDFNQKTSSMQDLNDKPIDNHFSSASNFVNLNELRKLSYDESLSDSSQNNSSHKIFVQHQEPNRRIDKISIYDNEIKQTIPQQKNKKLCSEHLNTLDTSNNLSTFTKYLENNKMLKYFNNDCKTNKIEDTSIDFTKLTKPSLFFQSNDKELSFDKGNENTTKDINNKNLELSYNSNDINTKNLQILTACQKVPNPYGELNLKLNKQNNNNFLTSENRETFKIPIRRKSKSVKQTHDQFNINQFDSSPSLHRVNDIELDDTYYGEFVLPYNMNQFQGNKPKPNINSKRSDYKQKVGNFTYPYYENPNNAYVNNSNKSGYDNIHLFNNSINKHYVINIDNNAKPNHNTNKNKNVNSFLDRYTQQYFGSQIDNNTKFERNQFLKSNSHKEMGNPIIRELKFFNNTKHSLVEYMNMDSEELILHSYNLTKDQNGCRYLQKKIDENPQLASLVYQRVFSHIVELINDSFGNYLIQKLFDYVSDEKLFQILAIMNADMPTIGTNSHGTRVIQKLITKLETDELIKSFIKILSPNVLDFIKDINGNHIIQKFINIKDISYSKFIYDIINDNIIEICTHKHGCCAIQKCIDNSKPDIKKAVIDKIISSSSTLIIDQYGNYVIQYILLMNIYEYNKQLIEGLIENISFLARQKYSSNVVEKFFDYCDKTTRNNLIQSLLKPETISNLLLDMYGNYVLQKTLLFTDEEDKLKILKIIAPLMIELKFFNFGPKLYSKLLITFPELNSLMFNIDCCNDQFTWGMNTKNGYDNNSIKLVNEKSVNKMNLSGKQNTEKLMTTNHHQLYYNTKSFHSNSHRNTNGFTKYV